MEFVLLCFVVGLIVVYFLRHPLKTLKYAGMSFGVLLIGFLTVLGVSISLIFLVSH